MRPPGPQERGSNLVRLGCGKDRGACTGVRIGVVWAEVCAPLKASVIPMGSPGAEPGTLVLGLG